MSSRESRREWRDVRRQQRDVERDVRRQRRLAAAARRRWLAKSPSQQAEKRRHAQKLRRELTEKMMVITVALVWCKALREDVFGSSKPALVIMALSVYAGSWLLLGLLAEVLFLGRFGAGERESATADSHSSSTTTTAGGARYKASPWSHGTGLIITPQKPHRFSHIFRTCHAHAQSPCCVHGRSAFYDTQTCRTSDEKWFISKSWDVFLDRTP